MQLNINFLEIVGYSSVSFSSSKCVAVDFVSVKRERAKHENVVKHDGNKQLLMLPLISCNLS